MDLNRLGNGKKFVETLIGKGQVKGMGLSPQQLQEKLNQTKNPKPRQTDADS